MTSDVWRAYDCLNDKGYDQFTVNHSLNFVDPDTGAHTQHQKYMVGSRAKFAHRETSKDLFESFLQEFVWPQHYGEDSFGNSMKHIVELY